MHTGWCHDAFTADASTVRILVFIHPFLHAALLQLCSIFFRSHSVSLSLSLSRCRFGSSISVHGDLLSSGREEFRAHMHASHPPL